MPNALCPILDRPKNKNDIWLLKLVNYLSQLLDIISISELDFQYPQGNSNPRRIRERDVS